MGGDSHLPNPLEATPITELPEQPVVAITEARATPIAKPKVIQEPGRGGRQHKYLQQLIKGLGEERGFRATIEETILDGAGRVDVSLRRDDLRVACQISITTTKDWELGGIEKCFAAGFTEVALICGSEKHQKSLSRFIEDNLDEGYRGKVTYILTEAIPEFLDGLGAPTHTEQVTRGYKVRTVRQSADSVDAAARRRAITEVIARSLNRAKEE